VGRYATDLMSSKQALENRPLLLGSVGVAAKRLSNGGGDDEPEAGMVGAIRGKEAPTAKWTGAQGTTNRAGRPNRRPRPSRFMR
jgi:hypothetical protein